jgi:predicted GNAT family acetyltransferase
MDEIQLKLDKNGRGAFFIEKNSEQLAIMEIGVVGSSLTVYHTEVNDILKGQGVANRLLDHMAAYARKNHLKVIPLCKFVHLQFTRHPDKYTDIWDKDWHKASR